MYTAKDLLDYFHDNIGLQKHRKPEYVDPRNYVIGVLHYKFNYTEFDLEEIFQVHRTTINYGKNQPYQHIETKNSVFLENAAELILKFPYEFPDPETVKKSHRSTERVILNIDKRLYKKLQVRAAKKGSYVKTVIVEMLHKVEKAWEE